jgi:hypothetical protein
LRSQPILPDRDESQQPGILVGLRVGGDDLCPVDVEPLEDLPDRLFPKPVGNRRVPPERPEVREQLVTTPQAHLVRSALGHPSRALQPAPGAAERFDRDLARGELALQLFPGHRDLSRVWPCRRQRR